LHSSHQGIRPLGPAVTCKKVVCCCGLCGFYDQIVRIGPVALAPAVRSAVANVGRESQLLQRQYQHIASIRLPPTPSESRRTGTRVMVAMPVLALKQMHEPEPGHVAARVFARRDARFGMANAINEALRVQSEAEANRAQPEKCGRAEIQSDEE